MASPDVALASARSTLALAMLLPALALTGQASANSFDCARASTLTEKAICSDPYTLELDSKLGQAWKTAKAKVADVGTLKAEQRQLQYRDYCATDFKCLRQSYLMRTAGLQYSSKPFNWNATWQRIPSGRFDSAEWKITKRGQSQLGLPIAVFKLYEWAKENAALLDELEHNRARADLAGGATV